MNSRERTFLAMARKTADRLPVDFWTSTAMKRKIEARTRSAYEDFLDSNDVDLRYIEGPSYIGPALESETDIWGVSRIRVKAGEGEFPEIYSEVKRSPLAEFSSVAEVENYGHWPSPDHFDYSAIEQQCEVVRASGRVAVFMGDRLNRVAQLKPAMYLRGMERILMDLMECEDIAHSIFSKIQNFYTEYLERILAAARGKLDIVLTGDDFGSQNGLLISPDLWRRFLLPGFARYIALIKEHGALAMHHTCGSVEELVPDLIEAGLDVLQSIQPEARGMDLNSLAEKYGARLSFHGGLSVQRLMPFGSPEQIRAEVSKIARLFKDKGGYIFCTSHNIQTDTPMENVEALLRAYRDSASNE